jgi:hypothetical protein
MPLDASFAEVVSKRDLTTFGSLIEVEVSPNQKPHESQKVCVGDTKAPIEPTGFIVLAICVVVSQLRAPNFVSHEQHRRSNGEKCECEKIPGLLHSQTLDVGIDSRTLDATVPAEIRISAISI